MKYQVTLNDKALSTHKNYELAQRALNRWMRKHDQQRQKYNDMIAWVDPKLIKDVSGIYCIKTVND